MTTLDEAIAALGEARVMAMVVSDGIDDDDWPENPIQPLSREDWPRYEVEEMSRSSHSATYASATAVAEHPGQRNVHIRIEFLYIFSSKP